MVRILGSQRSLCDGLSRREFLHGGALSGFGVGLTSLLQAMPSRSGSFGKAKACILLYLNGSPSQLETFDVKPDAPEGIRGELRSIPTSIPGYRVGELLPHTARVVDRTCVVNGADRVNRRQAFGRVAAVPPEVLFDQRFEEPPALGVERLLPVQDIC